MRGLGVFLGRVPEWHTAPARPYQRTAGCRRMTPKARLLRVSILGLASLAAAAGAWGVSVEALAMADAEDAPGARSAAAARAALLAQPLEASALRDLALARGGGALDLRLLALADRVSRRDFQTQILLLEASAQGGDTAATLRHYDALLSAAPAARDELFGVLTRALPIPEIQAGVLAYRDRAWFADLVAAAARQSGRARLALDLARRGGLLAPGEARDRLAPALIDALLSDGEAGAAAGLAGAVGPREWRDLGFGAAARDERLGAFAWRLAASPAVAAGWGEGGGLSLAVEPGRRAVAATRVTALAPGAYRLYLTLAASEPPAAQAEWRVACLGSEGEPFLAATAPAPEREIVHEEALTIPADCPLQSWSLWAEGEDAQTPSRVTLSRLAVVAAP